MWVLSRTQERYVSTELVTVAAFALILLVAAGFAATSIISFAFFAFQGSLHLLLPGFFTTKRKLIGWWILRATNNTIRRCLLRWMISELKIFAIQLPRRCRYYIVARVKKMFSLSYSCSVRRLSHGHIPLAIELAPSAESEGERSWNLFMVMIKRRWKWIWFSAGVCSTSLTASVPYITAEMFWWP